METYVHQVNYYETDKMGVTHHSNYIRFMEEARVDFMEQLGWGYDRMEKAGVGSPVIGLTADFKKTTTFPDKIFIEVRVLKISGLKLTIGYTMKTNDKIVFTGTSSHCFLDTNGRPVFIEKQFPDFYNQLQAFKVEE